MTHIVDGSKNVPEPAYVIHEWSRNIKARLKSYLEGDENSDIITRILIIIKVLQRG